MKIKNILFTSTFATILILTGCSSNTTNEESSSVVTVESTPEATATATSTTESVVTNFTGSSSGMLDTTDMFTDRDLTQTPDLTDATYYTVSDGQDITITEEGVYVIQGSASEVTIYVEADDASKVQIVLDGVTITNTDFPAIYVKSADKVFVTTISDSSLSVTGTFVADSENDVDAVIYSCDDLVLNGTSTLTISSTEHGIKSKDDLKITGGTYNITASSKGITAHDSIRIADGTLNIDAGTDGLHAEDSDDNSVGYIFVGGGSLNISAGDDGIHATTVLQIDGGSVNAETSVEGMEATYIQINGGTMNVNASDDGINASQKSTQYNPTIEITGGDITVTTPAGDTDGIDSNGNFTMTGGTLTLNCSGMGSIDLDGTGTFTGGTITVNGQNITDLSQVVDTMGMPGGMGEMQGGAPGNQGGMPNGQGGPGGI